MSSAEARDILWDFQKTFIEKLPGAYYDKLREAIQILYNESYYRDNPKEECNETCGCSWRPSQDGFDNYG